MYKKKKKTVIVDKEQLKLSFGQYRFRKNILFCSFKYTVFISQPPAIICASHRVNWKYTFLFLHNN